MRDAFVGNADWRDNWLYDLDALWLFRAVWLNSSSSPLDNDPRCANGVMVNPHGRPLSSRVCLFAGNFVVIGWRTVIVSHTPFLWIPNAELNTALSQDINIIVKDFFLRAGKFSKTVKKSEEGGGGTVSL